MYLDEAVIERENNLQQACQGKAILSQYRILIASM